jgi:hypothetical protein
MYRPIPELNPQEADHQRSSAKQNVADRGDDALCTSDDGHAAAQVKQVSLWGNI